MRRIIQSIVILWGVCLCGYVSANGAFEPSDTYDTDITVEVLNKASHLPETPLPIEELVGMKLGQMFGTCSGFILYQSHLLNKHEISKELAQILNTNSKKLALASLYVELIEIMEVYDLQPDPIKYPPHQLIGRWLLNGYELSMSKFGKIEDPIAVIQNKEFSLCRDYELLVKSKFNPKTSQLTSDYVTILKHLKQQFEIPLLIQKLEAEKKEVEALQKINEAHERQTRKIDKALEELASP